MTSALCRTICFALFALVSTTGASALTIRADVTGFNLADPDWAVLGIAPTSNASLWVTFDTGSPTSTFSGGGPGYQYNTAFYSITDFRLEFGSLTLDGFVSGPDFSTSYMRDAYNVLPGSSFVTDYVSFDIYENQTLPNGVIFDAFHIQKSNHSLDPDLVSGTDFSDIVGINAMMFENAYIRFFLPGAPDTSYAIGAFSGNSITLTNVTAAVPLPATAPLLLGELGLLAAAGWRRRRAQ